MSKNKVQSIEDAKNPNAPFKFGDELLKAWREEFGKDATDAQWKIFIDLCERRRAIPGKDIHFQLHNAWEWDEDTRTKKKIKKATHVSTCSFLQTLAERTGLYEGRTPTVYVYVDADDNMRDTTRPIQKKGEKFVGAEVTIKRKDRPDTTVFARFDAYAVTYKKDNVERLTQMWAKFGPEQTAKCAFAAAIRQAFPEDLGELHGEEEMEQAVAQSAIVEKQTAAPADPAFIPTLVAPSVVPGATVEHDSKPMPEVESVKQIVSAESAVSTNAETTVSPEQMMARELLKLIPSEKLQPFANELKEDLTNRAKETYQALGGDPAELPGPTDEDYAAAVEALGPDMAKDAPGIEQPGTQANELPAQAPTTQAAPEVPAPQTAPAASAPVDDAASPKEYTDFCNQAAKFANDVLVPGGILAGKGLTITAKLKKYILKTVGKTDLKKLSVKDWNTVFATLNGVAKGDGGPAKAVALIESKI
jgi:hypothetical protein